MVAIMAKTKGGMGPIHAGFRNAAGTRSHRFTRPEAGVGNRTLLRLGWRRVTRLRERANM